MLTTLTATAIFKGDGGIKQLSSYSASCNASFSFLSDSIFCTYPPNMSSRAMVVASIDSEIDKDMIDLTYAIQIAKMIQLSALKELGLLCRGAIVKGLAYHSDSNSIIFGSAINNAVCMEQEIANTPRIIIEKNLSKHVKFNKFIDEDSDGYPYIKCFDSTLLAPDNRDVLLIKKLIESNVVINKLKYQQKWIWMAKRFNEMLEQNVELQKVTEPVSIP